MRIDDPRGYDREREARLDAEALAAANTEPRERGELLTSMVWIGILLVLCPAIGLIAIGPLGALICLTVGLIIIR